MKRFEFARLDTVDGEPVMLKGVKATGDIKGLMFEAQVEQRFTNPSDSNMEVVYTFPLPFGSVLLGVEVLLGDKQLSGSVVEKKQAEAKYEEALSEGDAAIMLEQNHDESFTLNLGNLAAKEDCVVTIRYCQALQFDQHGLRLLIPTVIAPRFGDAVADGGLQPHQAPVHSLLAEYAFNIELRLHGDLARSRVASPSHPIGVSHSAAGGLSILTVSLGRNSSLDRDFVLLIDQLEQKSIAILARDSVQTDHVVAMASFCPRIASEGPKTTTVKVLVDCSGSMAGDSMQAAKRSLQAIVLQLAKGDKFSLSKFGTRVEHRSRGLWSATETTRLAARRWVGDLEANLGGTNMEAALSSTFALSKSVSSDILLITDGEISAIDQTIEAAKNSNHRAFIVGIGSSPAEGHLRRLAEATGGACDFVAPGEAVEPAVLRMFARLRSPRLTGLQMVWPEGVTPDWVSEMPVSVFNGDTVNVYALLKTEPVGGVKLSGRLEDETQILEIGFAQFGLDVESSTTLSRMAAAIRMYSLASEESTSSEAEATKLALDYELVSEFTNFLLIHERAEAEKQTDMPTLHKVQQMVPAGWGGNGSVDVLMCVDPSFGSSVPAVLRKSGSIFESAMSDAEIPAYLRKGLHSDLPSSFDEASNAGAAPLTLSNWLRATHESYWPSTYKDLKTMALDRWVLEWLELLVEKTFGANLGERLVVAAFLRVMVESNVHAAAEPLKSSLGLKGLVSKVVGMMASPAELPAPPQGLAPTMA